VGRQGGRLASGERPGKWEKLKLRRLTPRRKEMLKVRFIKTFGLAMLAALVAMALVAVNSASAKTLLLGASVCSKSGTGSATHCPAGTKALGLDDPLLVLGKSTFTSSFVKITCDTVMHGIVHNGDGLENGQLVFPLGLITSVLLTNCSTNVCTFEEASMSASAAVPWDVLVKGSATLGNGTLHVKNVLGKFRVNCGIFGGKQTCAYAKPEVLVDALGHVASPLTAATVHAKVTDLAREAGSGGLCSAEGSWEALMHAEPADLTIHLLEVLHP
jgi:hypothetical protein